MTRKLFGDINSLQFTEKLNLFLKYIAKKKYNFLKGETPFVAIFCENLLWPLPLWEGGTTSCMNECHKT